MIGLVQNVVKFLFTIMVHKMNNKWLILDCNYLCHRAAHSIGDLSYKGAKTGVVYGFLKDILFLQEKFDTKRIVFCWDKGPYLREELYPSYKQNRKGLYKKLTEEEKKFWVEFVIQVKKLRTRYLKTIGFSNIFYQNGYESDDIIASICFNLPEGDEAIIISNDQDLYQLIRWNVSFYSPQKRKLFTLQDFKRRYGIEPCLWTAVKVLAGCSTDSIPGIKGIGEKTAIKYLKGQLKKATKAYQAIISKKGNRIFKRNLKLVWLPFEGTKVFKLRKCNHFSNQGWLKVTKALGMKSLQNRNMFMKEKEWAR